MSRRTTIVIAILLIVASVGVYIYREYNRTNVSIADQKSAFRVSALQLIRDFNERDSFASKNYVGKVISVNGIVKDLNQDEKGYYTIILGDTTSMSSVRCAVDSMYSTPASSVKPGANITIKCTCTGYNKDEILGMDVIMNRCFLEL